MAKVKNTAPATDASADASADATTDANTDPTKGMPCAVAGEPGLFTVDYGYALNRATSEGDSDTALKLPAGYAAVRVDLVYEGPAPGKGITGVRTADGKTIPMTAPVMTIKAAGLVAPGSHLFVQFHTNPGILPATEVGQPNTDRLSKAFVYLRATKTG